MVKSLWLVRGYVVTEREDIMRGGAAYRVRYKYSTAAGIPKLRLAARKKDRKIVR
jgi:hypothetical protein